MYDAHDSARLPSIPLSSPACSSDFHPRAARSSHSTAAQVLQFYGRITPRITEAQVLQLLHSLTAVLRRVDGCKRRVAHLHVIPPRCSENEGVQGHTRIRHMTCAFVCEKGLCALGVQGTRRTQVQGCERACSDLRATRCPLQRCRRSRRSRRQ